MKSTIINIGITIGMISEVLIHCGLVFLVWLWFITASTAKPEVQNPQYVTSESQPLGFSDVPSNDLPIGLDK